MPLGFSVCALKETVSRGSQGTEGCQESCRAKQNCGKDAESMGTWWDSSLKKPGVLSSLLREQFCDFGRIISI